MLKLGAINVGALSIGTPTKIRVSGNFIPDFTINLEEENFAVKTTAKIIKPKITMLIGSSAYEFAYGQKMKIVDANIFDNPTFFDKYGILPLVFIVAAGLITYGVIRRK